MAERCRGNQIQALACLSRRRVCQRADFAKTRRYREAAMNRGRAFPLRFCAYKREEKKCVSRQRREENSACKSEEKKTQLLREQTKKTKPLLPFWGPLHIPLHRASRAISLVGSGKPGADTIRFDFATFGIFARLQFSPSALTRLLCFRRPAFL